MHKIIITSCTAQGQCLMNEPGNLDCQCYSYTLNILVELRTFII